MKDNKHLYWIVGLVLITIILCGTLIWLNHNSWIIRFEMDDNTKEAIESINFEEISNSQQDERNYVSVCNLLNDSTGYCGDGAIDPDVVEIYGDCKYGFVFSGGDE